jgi:hypothetical protein
MDQEPNVEEFYSVCFSPDGRACFAAGALKSREKWNEEDRDLEVTSGIIKARVFILDELFTRAWC